MRRISILISLIVFMFSCEQSDLDIPANKITVQEVQDHFNNFVTNHPNGRTESSPIDIIWDMAQFREISTGEAIVFPMDFPENQFISGADGIKVKVSQATFAFAYEIENEIHLQIVKQVPTKVTSRFTGYMLVENLDGETIRYFEFENGEFIEEYEIGDEPENGRVTCEITEYYTCTVRTEGPDDCTLDRTSLSCKYAPTLAGPDPFGGDYGGGGGSGGSDPATCEDGYFADANGNCIILECEEGFVLDENGNCVQQSDLEKIMECEELSDAQLSQLEGVLANYLSNCFLLNIYEYQVDNETKLCFKMGSSNDEEGGYQSGEGSILFNSDGSINLITFSEEFFHSYQHTYYGSLPTQAPFFGRSNIEFEAKMYWDIVTQPGPCCLAIRGVNAPVTEYWLWLSEISNDFTSIPDWNLMQDDYYYWLEKFVEFNPDYNYPIDYNKKPDAMLNFSGPC